METLSPGFAAGDEWVDLMAHDPRAQMADIADVGARNFVVGYVGTSGDLRYVYYDATAGREVAPFSMGGEASWLRANSSESWTISGCAVNYVAVETDGAIALDAHTKCPTGWTSVTRTPVDDGIAARTGRPSVVTRGTPDAGDLLVVYGKEHRIMGRFQSFPSGELGAPFPILEVQSNLLPFSTDVIYNQHSGRFIVGAIERYELAGCRIRNAVFSADSGFPPVIEAVTQFGTCDTEAGGHHTAVAYDPHGDGTYLWWRLDMNLRKAIYVHDATGALTSFPSFPTTEALVDPPSTYHRYTVPIAVTGGAALPYVFLKANLQADGTTTSGMYGSTQDRTWTLVGTPAPHESQLAARFVFGRAFGLMRSLHTSVPCPNNDLYLVITDQLLIAKQ